MAILQLQHAPQVEKDQLHNGHLEVQQLRAFHPGCHNQHELVLIKSFVNIKFALISGYLKKNRLFGWLPFRSQVHIGPRYISWDASALSWSLAPLSLSSQFTIVQRYDTIMSVRFDFKSSTFSLNVLLSMVSSSSWFCLRFITSHREWASTTIFSFPDMSSLAFKAVSKQPLFSTNSSLRPPGSFLIFSISIEEENFVISSFSQVALRRMCSPNSAIAFTKSSAKDLQNTTLLTLLMCNMIFLDTLISTPRSLSPTMAKGSPPS